MEYQFTVNRRRVKATRRQVEEALRGVKPEPVTRHAVEVRGVKYPVKQAFAVTFGVERADFITNTARRVFQRLGFVVTSAERRAVSDELTAKDSYPPAPLPPEGGKGTAARVRARFPHAAAGKKAAEVERLEVPGVVLEWSEWERWEDLEEDDRGGGGVDVPDASPGVYEARIDGAEERLTIGRASDLRARVKQGLVRGNRRHPAGEKIRKNEDTAQVRVRWAVTDRPGAAEEELHKRHVLRHGRLPKYTGHT